MQPNCNVHEAWSTRGSYYATIAMCDRDSTKMFYFWIDLFWIRGSFVCHAFRLITVTVPPLRNIVFDRKAYSKEIFYLKFCSYSICICNFKKLFGPNLSAYNKAYVLDLLHTIWINILHFYTTYVIFFPNSFFFCEIRKHRIKLTTKDVNVQSKKKICRPVWI